LLQSQSEAFFKQHWHTLVLDEAQAIKNAQAKRTKAVQQLQGDMRVVCTGTPLENHLGELWSLFRFLNPGLLGSQDAFNERYAYPIERGDNAARKRLKRLIQPFFLRRTKTEVLAELPPRVEVVYPVQLSAPEIALYEATRRQALEAVSAASGKGKDARFQMLAEITRLRRLCCHPDLVMPEAGLSSAKMEAFAELVSDLLDNHHKALVFSQFVDVLTKAREVLEKQNVSYQYLDGATPQAERKKRVDAFQAGQGDVFLISLKAGGTGLNLTAADYVIHLDPWWNPAVEDQASDRAHRMGQTRPVTIYRLVAKDTIEERIVSLHAKKRELADSLLADGDAGARVGAEELLALLKEERGSV
jgi:SNF2 family DNA or RNA helicase